MQPVANKIWVERGSSISKKRTTRQMRSVLVSSITPLLLDTRTHTLKIVHRHHTTRSLPSRFALCRVALLTRPLCQAMHPVLDPYASSAAGTAYGPEESRRSVRRWHDQLKISVVVASLAAFAPTTDNLTLERLVPAKTRSDRQRRRRIRSNTH